MKTPSELYLIKMLVNKSVNMKFKRLFFVIIILNARLVYGDPVDTTRLFYNINQDKLTYANKIKIDSLMTTLKNVSEIKVLGYSDYLGDKNSNYILSVKRAQKVKKYLSYLNIE